MDLQRQSFESFPDLPFGHSAISQLRDYFREVDRTDRRVGDNLCYLFVSGLPVQQREEGRGVQHRLTHE